MNEPGRKKLTDLIAGNPEAELKLDLIECKLRSENLVLPFTLNEGARDSLIRGMWDPLEELIEANSEIERVSKTLNYT
jgi:3-isopropylmalate/(R)-2-methylmalate dehydratase small subunit